MTIVFEQGNSFWIETIEAIVAATAGATTFATVALEKEGIFLGAGLTAQANNSNNTEINCGIRDSSNAVIPIGTTINAVRLWVRNDDVGTNTVTVTVCIMMRGSGH